MRIYARKTIIVLLKEVDQVSCSRREGREKTNRDGRYQSDQSDFPKMFIEHILKSHFNVFHNNSPKSKERLLFIIIYVMDFFNKNIFIR